ncbi:ATP-dependent DNA helicase II subunit 2 [Podosphaera aphanis]|nr:ATP-dependent DNA helicase II subunit 2 [Podosphaera aphanis]
MADKQATIFVIDIGKTTGDIRNGRTESDLNYVLQYFWAKISDIMATNRSTLSVGVIAFRTDETINSLGDGYENISILAPLGVMNIPTLNKLRPKLIPSQTSEGDAISALVVAIAEMEDFTRLKSGKPGKYIRKIILFTDGEGFIDNDESDEIVDKINESGIQLTVIGVDFDDPEFGFKEEDKALSKVKIKFCSYPVCPSNSLQLENEKALKNLVDKCEMGLFGTAAAAIEQISLPTVKATKPYVSYEGRLTLGDIEKYPESTICIDVKRYFRVKKAIPPSSSCFVSQTPHTMGEKSNSLSQIDMSGSVFSPVRNARTYKIDDSSAPGGKKDVPYESLVKGYQYGRTIVPINESDQGITDLETFQSFTIIGFIRYDGYEKYLNMDESCITIALPVSEKAQMAMSSLVHALHELESYAVARIVPKNGNTPSILLLAPFIEPLEMEALIDVPLPFAEDIRPYQFPPLDKVITVSGVVLTEHRNLPSIDLASAMSDYVDAMDLSELGKDDEGSPQEYMTVQETYNPALHHINYAISQRAMFPDRPVPAVSDELVKWSKIPPELVSKSAPQLEKLAAVAAIKEVPPKAKGKQCHKEILEPKSGLDIDTLLGF